MKTAWPDHATFSVECARGTGAITVTRSLAYNFMLVDPKDYGSLHAFYQQVAVADQAQLALSRSTSAKAE